MFKKAIYLTRPALTRRAASVRKYGRSIERCENDPGEGCVLTHRAGG